MLMKPTLITLLVMVTLTFASAQTKETRQLGTFTRISFRVPGTLYVRQGSPQKVELEGDADVLKEIKTDLDDDKLVIEQKTKWGWNWGDHKPITIRITVKDIETLSVSGSGNLIVEGKLNTASLNLNVSGSGSLQVEADASGTIDADVSGSGDLTVKGKGTAFRSDVSGSGKIYATLNITEQAGFEISGSGKVEAKGNAASVKAVISGSGKVLAAGLQTDRCRVNISGSGDVEIDVKSDLDVNISGSGSVGYKGSPGKVNCNASGSGKVYKL